MEKGEGIEVRHATERDVAAIALLLRESFIEYQDLYTDEAFAYTTSTAAEIRERLHEGPILVASRRGVIVGTVSVIKRGEELYIRGMAVAPDARGLRLGQTMLDKIEELAGEERSKRLVLSTTPFLLRAIRLYESKGYLKSDDGPYDLYGTPLFTMVKELDIR